MSVKNQNDPFNEQIRLALSNFHDASWLGEESPLAAPYFLGTALQNEKDGRSAEGRGQVLKLVLNKAASRLWLGKLPHSKEQLVDEANKERQEIGSRSARYYYLLLDLRYFRRYFKPAMSPRIDDEQAIRAFLGLGRGTFFNHLKAARIALGEALLDEARPTFRLEQPLKLPPTLIGVEQKIKDCLTRLESNQTISISGMGGVGKTSLADAVAQRWQSGAVFWFTVSPSFNDKLSSFLFSLGYFLHEQGASNLWLQLIADNGQMENLNLALEHIRGDLHGLDKRPLLCIDEVDYLQIDQDKTQATTAQLFAFLQQLYGLLPLVFIGQRPLFKADYFLELTGFSREETAVYLKEKNIHFTIDELQHLQSYTGGNPRLIQLCTILYDEGNPFTDIFKNLPQTVALHALFSRVWQRVSPEEKSIILNLAVFRSPSPEDAWTEEKEGLDKLIKRQIVVQDTQGGVSLLPAIRDLIYEDHQRLTAEIREQAHLFAAQVRMIRGEYTAAVYHFIEANEPEKALHVWFPFRQHEIRRGQATTALALFQKISARRLPQEEQEALALLRVELYELLGETKEGQAELEEGAWQTDSELKIQAQFLRGNFLNALGFPHTALEESEKGIEITARLLRQMVKFRNQRAIIHVQQRRLKQAWHESRIAQYESERLQGFLQSEQGQYDDAYLSYQRAMALAKSIHEDAGVAQINREMAVMLGLGGKLALAEQHAQDAIDYYRQIGDRLTIEKLHNTLSGIFFQAGEFTKAIEFAEIALPFFQGAKLPYWTAVTAATLAEAYFEVGELDKATQNAHLVLNLEETQSHPYALYTLGLVMRAQNEFEQANRYFQEATTISEANQDWFMAAYAWRMQAQTFLDLEMVDKAEMATQKALKGFETLDIVSEIEATKKLATIIFK